MLLINFMTKQIVKFKNFLFLTLSFLIFIGLSNTTLAKNKETYECDKK